MKQWSSRVHLLAKTLLDYALIHPNKLTLQNDIWKSFHVTLVNELILDNSTPNMTKFHTNFLEGTSLKENVERFRQIISNETFIHYYCQKLKVARGPVTRKKKKVDQSTRLETFWQLLKDESLPQYDKSMTIQFEIFESYRKDLEKEAVIVPKIKNNGKLFTDQFIQSSSSLSDRALEFRKILSNKIFIHCWKKLTFQVSETFGKPIIQVKNKEETGGNGIEALEDNEEHVKEFLEKLVFAVETPNEVQLGQILTKEVGKLYNLNESDFQSDFILRKMLDWFKEKESIWYSSVRGNQMLQEC